MPFVIVEEILDSAGKKLERREWGPYKTTEETLRQLEAFHANASEWTYDPDKKCWLSNGGLNETRQYSVEKR